LRRASRRLRVASTGIAMSAAKVGQSPCEGHINRLKAIKRQMYGRAGFELLKARVLPWNASSAA
jgi:hypothetical protein